MGLNKDLKEFLGLLLSRKVEYLVVGAHAVAFHGHPRFTGDIDFLIRTEPENAARMELACRDFGFAGYPFVADEFLVPGQVFQLGRSPNRIDIMTGISGVPTEEAWEGKVGGRLGEFAVFFLSKEHLIKNKSLTGRTKDLADVELLSRR